MAAGAFTIGSGILLKGLDDTEEVAERAAAVAESCQKALSTCVNNFEILEGMIEIETALNDVSMDVPKTDTAK